MPSARRLSVIVTLLIVSFIGCARQPPMKPVTGYSPDIGGKAAKNAISMIGKPYKFQGDSPEGFDCSGLVQYSYLAAGLEVPHGTSALKNVSRPVGKHPLPKGEEIFPCRNLYRREFVCPCPQLRQEGPEGRSHRPLLEAVLHWGSAVQ
jgi:hypothetical protein